MKLVLLQLLFSCVCLTAYGFQETEYFRPGGGFPSYEAEDLSPAAGDWDELTRGISYKEKAPEKAEEKEADHPPPPPKRSADNGFLIKLLLVLVGLAGLVLAILHFTNNIDLFKSDRKLRRSARDLSLTDIEDQLDSVDLKDPIEQVIAEGNYAVAVRLLYLQSIQALNDHQLIRWKRDKTNGEYLRELPEGTLRRDFTELTGVFERIWYGEKPIGRTQFPAVQAQFSRMQQSIQNSPRP